MPTWLWSVEAAKRGARHKLTASAVVLFGTLGFAIGGALALQLLPRPGNGIEVAHAEAAQVAGALRDLSADYGSCSAALIHLPERQPAATLRRDPWGNPWSIRCHGDLAVVRSAGPDAQIGTGRDIVEVAVAPSVGR